MFRAFFSTATITEAHPRRALLNFIAVFTTESCFYGSESIEYQLLSSQRTQSERINSTLLENLFLKDCFAMKIETLVDVKIPKLNNRSTFTLLAIIQILLSRWQR